jgi:hypothetical protein
MSMSPSCDATTMNASSASSALSSARTSRHSSSASRPANRRWTTTVDGCRSADHLQQGCRIDDIDELPAVGANRSGQHLTRRRIDGQQHDAVERVRQAPGPTAVAASAIGRASGSACSSMTSPSAAPNTSTPLPLARWRAIATIASTPVVVAQRVVVVEGEPSHIADHGRSTANSTGLWPQPRCLSYSPSVNCASWISRSASSMKSA